MHGHVVTELAIRVLIIKDDTDIYLILDEFLLSVVVGFQC